MGWRAGRREDFLALGQLPEGGGRHWAPTLRLGFLLFLSLHPHISSERTRLILSPRSGLCKRQGPQKTSVERDLRPSPGTDQEKGVGQGGEGLGLFLKISPKTPHSSSGESEACGPVRRPGPWNAMVVAIGSVGSRNRRARGDWDAHSAFQGRDEAGLGEWKALCKPQESIWTQPTASGPGLPGTLPL